MDLCFQVHDLRHPRPDYPAPGATPTRYGAKSVLPTKAPLNAVQAPLDATVVLIGDQERIKCLPAGSSRSWRTLTHGNLTVQVPLTVIDSINVTFVPMRKQEKRPLSRVWAVHL